MPVSTSLRKLLCCIAGMQQEEEAEARPGPARPDPVQAGPEPAEVGPAQAGRPYRGFVEGEAGRFRRALENDGSLNEPDQQEAGAVALPGLPSSRRGSPGPQPVPVLTREQMAVHVVQMYLVKKGFIKPPYSRLESTPDHVEALLQLLTDANWQPRQIPLPAHPDPQHPAIYYYINDPVRERPVPREDALLRGDYIYTQSGDRFVDDDHIPPWRGRALEPTVADLRSRKLKRCYSLNRTGETLEIRIHWLNDASRLRSSVMSITLENLRFLPKSPRKNFDIVFS